VRGRAALVPLLSVALLATIAQGNAQAHAGLTLSDPAPGATLGASPTAVRLTFSERPQVSLSVVKVVDARGLAHQSGAHPAAVTGDPLSLVAQVPRLPRGVYTVSWRAVSAVDGHANAGAYAFGVGVSPKGVVAAAPTARPVTSALELVARWTLLIGLALLLGTAVAGAARFDGAASMRLAAPAWLFAVAGLLLLAEAQRRTADTSLSGLLDTPVGRALVWRAVAIAAAGAALILAWRTPRIRTLALAGTALASVAAIVVHVAAGHAAAGSWPHALTVAAQATHFTAAGIWFGGLAALLLGVRGAPSDAKAAAVGRCAGCARAAVGAGPTTGTIRAIDELSSPGQLVSSGYGRAIVAKAALLALIVALGARHRRLSVPRAATDLRPLRRTSRVELALAAGALGAAAFLGALAPPVTGQPARDQGLRASGADFATTVRVRLEAPSAEAGPNRFVARVEDYDSHAPVEGARVRLRFTPLDDPGAAATSLALAGGRGGSYAGTGANLEFDGRWRVTALVQRGADAVEVPLELDVKGPPQFVSVLRIPGQDAAYTMEVGTLGYMRITPHPGRAGPSTVTVDVFDPFESETPVSQLVVTGAAGDRPAHQQAVRRLGPGRFAASVELARGRYTIVAVARTQGGSRLRGVFELDVPGG
jgi:copper transport protein